MITSTSLSSLSVGIKLFKAIRLACKTRQKVWVYNRKGEPFMCVSYLQGTMAKLVLGNKVTGLYFSDHNGKDITKTVLKVLQSVY